MRILTGAVLTLLSIASARAEDAPSGIWTGRYMCAQGETALTLTVERGSGSALRALFHFYASPQNPEVPEGCFAMTGTFDRAGKTVSLQAGNWILRPPGYVTVDLAGRIETGGRHFSGSVIGPDCTVFDLTRAGGPRRPADACHPAGPEIVSAR
jgi:hypothetical protein